MLSLAALAGALVGPGAASAAVYTGGWQDVESYQARKGVPLETVLAHETAVGQMRTVDGDGGGERCSGTLIGDGVFLTVGHCVESGDLGRTVRFNYQLDPDGNARSHENHRIEQILEDNPDAATFGGVDHGLIRMAFHPENEYGFATMESRAPDPATPAMVIGHPVISGETDRKTVNVLDIACVRANADGLDFEFGYADGQIFGGSSGSGVWDPVSGRLIGVNRANTRHCPSPNTGMANTILRHQLVSDWLDEDRGSGRMYTDTGTGLTTRRWTLTNWGSAWHHIVPGQYRGRTTQELFFYNSADGSAQFYVVSNSGISRLGPAHTGLNAPGSPWGQIVPVQIDDTPQQELLFLNTRTGRYLFRGTDGAGNLGSVAPPCEPFPNCTPGVIRFPITGPAGTTPRLAAAGDFIDRPGQEILLHFPLENRVALYGPTSDGRLTFLAALDGVPTSSILLAGEFRAAASGDEALLYDPIARQVTVLSFDAGMRASGPIDLPGGLATQIATGNLADGAANLLVYQPSTEDIYANVAENTGTLSHLMLDADTGLSTVIASPGERRTFAKVITGDFVTNNDPNVILYDRYKR